MPKPNSLPAPKNLIDYAPPDWRVPQATLRFELDAVRTLVHARLEVQCASADGRPLRLDGEGLELLALRIDGVEQPLPNARDGGLELALAGRQAVVETVVAICPSANTQLMGLYASGGALCTQCEAEGFRRITYFPDRPDVLTRFSVRLEADLQACPVLLGNGNPGDAGLLGGGRHFAEWDDPFPKPSYLFALVAGRLEALRDTFTTVSGRVVQLAIWVEAADIPRCGHAMASLKQAMAWDERVYGREYDLDVFNIVAVSDFNFGAMENKGLNIFNAKYVLADADTATDHDFDSIAAVVAHEYFHNWSGNRVTCRDWFQLALKEGFTVFRDQQFSADLGSAAVRRIEMVRSLRSQQFPEDAGPMAHPVRPESYLEINNFYTTTVYNKGAEVIRMMAEQLGPERYRRACDRYFAENDGTAATVEDFLAAMATEGLDAPRFLRWYSQAGTPKLTVDLQHFAEEGRALLHVAQTNPRHGALQEPQPIPLSVALFSADGRMMAARADLLLTDAEDTFMFQGIDAAPILSMNRGFAAPVRLASAPDRAALAVLAAHEDDPFARYEALQQLMHSALSDSMAAGRDVGHGDVVAAVASALAGWGADPAFVAEAILLPSESLVGDQQIWVNPPAILAARDALRLSIRQALAGPLWEVFAACQADGRDLSARAKGLRRLKGITLGYLMAGDPDDATAAAFAMFEAASCMTDRMAALSALSHSHSAAREDALRQFYDRYQGLPEVLDKWFAVQAASTRTDTLEVVQRLAEHPQFDLRNPNRLRALALGFAGNQARFHDPSGAGYAWLAGQVLAADRINPQSAARLVGPLARWRRLQHPLGLRMHDQLVAIRKTPGLSRDVSEVVVSSI